MASQVPRDPTLTPEMRRFLDDLARRMDSVEAEATASTDDIDAIEAAWTAYTPTISSGTGTFTSASATGRYITIGKTTFVSISIAITTNGSAATYILASLPKTANSKAGLTGRENGVSGKLLQGAILSGTGGATNALIIDYNNSYPGVDGAALVLSGVYENT